MLMFYHSTLVYFTFLLQCLMKKNVVEHKTIPIEFYSLTFRYCIQDINCTLYKTVSEMKYARALRFQLYFLNEYIRTCRNGRDLLDSMTLRNHIISEPQLFSLEVCRPWSLIMAKNNCVMLNFVIHKQ